LLKFHRIQEVILQAVFFFFFFFFLANFRNLATKKKGLANPTKGFFRFFFKKSPYVDPKSLEVARFRQCVPVVRQK
jgi:hypothetical protein